MRPNPARAAVHARGHARPPPQRLGARAKRRNRRAPRESTSLPHPLSPCPTPSRPRTLERLVGAAGLVLVRVQFERQLAVRPGGDGMEGPLGLAERDSRAPAPGQGSWPDINRRRPLGQTSRAAGARASAPPLPPSPPASGTLLSPRRRTQARTHPSRQTPPPAPRSLFQVLVRGGSRHAQHLVVRRRRPYPLHERALLRCRLRATDFCRVGGGWLCPPTRPAPCRLLPVVRAVRDLDPRCAKTEVGTNSLVAVLAP